MKVIYHPKMVEQYAYDPAAEPGRLDGILDRIEEYPFITPTAASEKSIALVHTKNLINHVQNNKSTYDMALLAVGGAIQAAEMAYDGEPIFGLIRPPGHHASPNGNWGFCYFNNIAIAVENLRTEQNLVKEVAIVDFDLHFGDGTANTFANIQEVRYSHPEASIASDFIKDMEEDLERLKPCDILAVSAGFDRGKSDWQNMLGPADYTKIGIILKDFAEEQCEGKRFALLEGGYNHLVLGEHVAAFLEGFR